MRRLFLSGTSCCGVHLVRRRTSSLRSGICAVSWRPSCPATLPLGERVAVILILIRGDSRLGHASDLIRSADIAGAGGRASSRTERGDLGNLSQARSSQVPDGRTLRVRPPFGPSSPVERDGVLWAMRDVDLAPQNTVARCRLHIRELTVSNDSHCGAAICPASHLRSDAVLPSFDSSGVALDLKTTASGSIVPPHSESLSKARLRSLIASDDPVSSECGGSACAALDRTGARAREFAWLT